MKSGSSRFLLKRRRKDPFHIQKTTPIDSPTSEREIADDAGISERAIASIATNTWRAKTKMTNPVTGEIRDEMKRVARHVEAIYRNLAELGIVIRDHTGDAYDEGQPMKVVASKPTSGLDKKRVSETLLPSIFWNDRLIQNGEIEIAVPITTDGSTEAEIVSS